MIAAATGVALLALAASPLRAVVPPGGTVAVTVRNVGGSPAAVTAAPAGYRLDLRGRTVLGRANGTWLRASTARLVLQPGTSGLVLVRALAPRRARPGDHAQVLLLTGHSLGSSGIRLAARIGVVLVVRCPGLLRHRLQPARLTRKGRVLRLVLANRGNADEWIGRHRIAVRLVRSGRVLAILYARPRRVLAASTAVFEWRLPARLSGPVRATTTVGGRILRRDRLRL